jgi:hypothetical protein
MLRDRERSSEGEWLKKAVFPHQSTPARGQPSKKERGEETMAKINRSGGRVLGSVGGAAVPVAPAAPKPIGAPAAAEPATVSPGALVASGLAQQTVGGPAAQAPASAPAQVSAQTVPAQAPAAQQPTPAPVAPATPPPAAKIAPVVKTVVAPKPAPQPRQETVDAMENAKAFCAMNLSEDATAFSGAGYTSIQKIADA